MDKPAKIGFSTTTKELSNLKNSRKCHLELVLMVKTELLSFTRQVQSGSKPSNMSMETLSTQEGLSLR